MNGWRPTHVVPPGGLPAWQEPNPLDQPVAHLDPGLDVAVVEQQGAWVRVVCSNGWAAWVAAAALTAAQTTTAPAPAPAPATRRRRWLVPVTIVIVAAAGAGALVLAGGGEGDDEESAPAADEGPVRAVPIDESASQAAVALHVPDGWAVSDDRLTAAETADDLTAGSPAGPVVTVTVTDDGADADPVEAIAEAIADESAVTVVEPPAAMQVDGADGVAAAFRYEDRVLQLVIVRRGEVSVTFTTDVPADRWEALAGVVNGVPGLR